MISYIDFDNFRRSFEIPRSRRLVTVGERLSDDKSYIRDTIIKACWGTPWPEHHFHGDSCDISPVHFDKSVSGGPI